MSQPTDPHAALRHACTAVAAFLAPLPAPDVNVKALLDMWAYRDTLSDRDVLAVTRYVWTGILPEELRPVGYCAGCDAEGVPVSYAPALCARCHGHAPAGGER